MGLFRPFDEDANDAVNYNRVQQIKNGGVGQFSKRAISSDVTKTFGKKANKESAQRAIRSNIWQKNKDQLDKKPGEKEPNWSNDAYEKRAVSDGRNLPNKAIGRTINGNTVIYNHLIPGASDFRSERSIKKSIARHNKKINESTFCLLGITDEDFAALEEGCNSDTCKCKGGTCPVKTTDGISTSAAASKKLLNMGKNNETDLNAVTPNAEYNQQNDAKFIGDGDSPATSKTNIPAILAAKTAGGVPHDQTVKNGINGTSPSIFKLKKFTKDDPDGY